MKRLISLCVALALVLCLWPQPAAQAASQTGTVKGGWLRLRASASMTAETLASYPTGTTVTILSSSGNWYKVRTADNLVGYMLASYLTVKSGSSGSTVTPPSGVTDGSTAYVTSKNGKGVRLRTSPDLNGEIIGFYNVGTRCTILSRGTYWHYVSIGSQKGYMMAEYLSITGSSNPTVPSVPSGNSYTAYVTSKNGKGVNLRESTSTTSRSLGLYPVGTSITVLGYGSTWCSVQVGGTVGYMMTSFISTTKPSVPSVPSSGNSYAAYVTSKNGKGVNLREQATAASRSLGLYPVGTPITVLSYGSTWCSVQVGGTVGYMMTSFITTTKPSVGYTKEVTGVALSNYTPTVGTMLTANVTPSGATVSYQWADDNGRLLSSTASCTVTADMVGRKIYLRVTGYGSYSGSVASSYTMAVANSGQAAANITGVSLSNTNPKVGETIAAYAVPSGASANYTWYRDNATQAGTGSTYIVQTADVGRRLYCVAVGTGNATGTAASQYTAVIPQPQSEEAFRIMSVTLSNPNPKVGDLITANILPAEGTATYTWFRDDDQVVSTNRTYAVAASDAGHQLYCWAQGTGNTTGSATSTYTARVVANAETPLSGTVALPNGAVVGTVLVPTLSLNSNNIAYQWYQNGVLVGTGSTLTLTDSMAGDDIRLVVQAMPGSGFSGDVGSNYCLVQRQVNPGITEV